MSVSVSVSAELALILDEIEKRQKLQTIFDSRYSWQINFINKTAEYRSCNLMAANRVGKTDTGIFIDGVHATGDYPEGWEGHRFYHPPLIWLLGYSGEKIRDLLQKPLFGTYSNGQLSGGLIPKEKIVSSIPMMGTAGAVREVKVKHRLGESTVQFWSYSQGQHALMGDSVDWYHIDEEPKDAAIQPQVITRTATGNKGKGGRGISTFTPENGKTELVVRLMDNPSPQEYMMRVTWDDAPHLTEETKESLLSMYPPHQRDMRTKGLPLMGAGLIFDLDIQSCLIPSIPRQKHWKVINGIDFGWDHPQAHVQIWDDREEDIIYVSHAWKKSKIQPYEAWQNVKNWAQGYPTAWPHDGLQTEKGSAKQQKKYYEDAGWKMLHEHATWESGGNGVEHGIVELYNRFKTGRIKIFNHLSDLVDEATQYHRDDNGKIVKINDDLLSALRYAYMMRRFATYGNEDGKVMTFNVPQYKS